MAYQPINKPKSENGWDKKKDCKDFIPFDFSIKYCKLSGQCKKIGFLTSETESTKVYYEEFGSPVELCLGMKKEKW